MKSESDFLEQLKNILTPGENLELQTYVNENKIVEVKLALEQFANTRNWRLKAGERNWRLKAGDMHIHRLDQQAHHDQIACQAEKERLRELFGQIAVNTELEKDVLKLETEASACNQRIVSLERDYFWKDEKASAVAQNAKLQEEIFRLQEALCQFVAENSVALSSSREMNEKGSEQTNLGCRR